MKEKIFKILKKAIICFSALYLGVVLGYNLFYWQHQRKAENIQKKIKEILTKPYLEDTYGGKTPQETFDMFLEALEKGDIELASNYFVLDRREKLKKELEEIVEKGYLDELINDLLQAKLEQSPILGSYRFILEHEKGGYKVYVPLDQNINGIWKIEDF